MPFPKHYPPARKKPTDQLPPQTPEKPSGEIPKQSFRSSSQVICPSRHHTGIKSCCIKSHPTVPGGRYCARHQKLCHQCEGSPRHKITEKCPNCMNRWRKEERETKKNN